MTMPATPSSRRAAVPGLARALRPGTWPRFVQALFPILAGALLVVLGLLGSASSARAAEAEAGSGAERLQVTDPYLELHTGPGRGFPVFHVTLRHDWVEVLRRHTDWFQVRTADGREGWVHRTQLESTLTAAGGRKSFRDLLLDDYLRRRAMFGGSWGVFKSEPTLKLWGGYRLSDSLSVEATLGQVQGKFSGTSYWHVALTADPWSERRLSPFVGVGIGRLNNVPNASLVDARSTDANLALVMAGVRWHFGERLVLRADYSIYTGFVSDTRSQEYRALTAGLSFFF